MAKASRKVIRKQISCLMNKFTQHYIDSLDEEDCVVYEKRMQGWLSEIRSADYIVYNELILDDNIDVDAVTAVKEANEEYISKIDRMTEKLKKRKGSLIVPVFAATVPGNVNAMKGTKLKLPNVELPEFHADESKDKLTCQVFFNQFESQLTGYNLDQTTLYSLLKSKLKGKALAMVESLSLVNQSYTEARKLLLEAFSQIVPVQFNAVRKLLNLKMSQGDSLTYFSDFRKVFVSLDELNIDLEIIKQYIVWEGMSQAMQDCLVQVTGETYPDCNLIRDKYMLASNRFEANKSKKKSSKVEVSSNAVALEPSKQKPKPKQEKQSSSFVPFCRLCKSQEHVSWKCSKFVTAQDRIKELNRLKSCTKCASNKHSSYKCDFPFNKKCSYCGLKHFNWLCVSNENQNSNSNKAYSKRAIAPGGADSSDPLTKE